MLITRTSILSRQTNTRDVPCTHEQYANWVSGMHIQDAMPNVPAEEREFLISGITPEEWKATFGNGEEG